MQNPSTFKLRCCQHFLPVSLFALVSLFVDLSLLPVSLSLCVCCLLDLCLGGVATITNHHTMNGASDVVLAVKNPPANAGDRRHSSIPGSGRSPGGGHGNPVQYSCLEDPVDGGAWWVTDRGVTKSRTRLKNLARTRASLFERPGLSYFGTRP